MTLMGAGNDLIIGFFEEFRCNECHEMWQLYEPNELTELEIALVQEALSAKFPITVVDIGT